MIVDKGVKQVGYDRNDPIPVNVYVCARRWKLLNRRTGKTSTPL
jgi:hypothetical protein